MRVWGFFCQYFIEIYGLLKGIREWSRENKDMEMFPCKVGLIPIFVASCMKDSEH